MCYQKHRENALLLKIRPGDRPTDRQKQTLIKYFANKDNWNHDLCIDYGLAYLSIPLLIISLIVGEIIR